MFVRDMSGNADEARLLARVKLVAEPWDIGEGGYQVGNFPPLFAEWNDHYRDAARRFWLAGWMFPSPTSWPKPPSAPPAPIGRATFA